MDVQIKSSKKNRFGEITVYFDNGWYYAHGITSIGKEDDSPSHMSTMWAWINHMREKRWWNNELESDFIIEVSKYLK